MEVSPITKQYFPIFEVEQQEPATGLIVHDRFLITVVSGDSKQAGYKEGFLIEIIEGQECPFPLHFTGSVLAVDPDGEIIPHVHGMLGTMPIAMIAGPAFEELKARGMLCQEHVNESRNATGPSPFWN